MSFVISPWNGAVIEVLDSSILLRTAKRVNRDGTPYVAETNIVVNNRPVVTSTTSTVATNERANRQKQMDQYTGWDNDPSVRILQERSWIIYIDTGSWQSAEQKKLHEDAEQIRRYNNPMYTGLKDGPRNWMDAEQITPRTTTPGANTIEGMLDGAINPENYGTYLKYGVSALFVFIIVSMFRR